MTLVLLYRQAAILQYRSIPKLAKTSTTPEYDNSFALDYHLHITIGINSPLYKTDYTVTEAVFKVPEGQTEDCLWVSQPCYNITSQPVHTCCLTSAGLHMLTFKSPLCHCTYCRTLKISWETLNKGASLLLQGVSAQGRINMFGVFVFIYGEVYI